MNHLFMKCPHLLGFHYGLTLKISNSIIVGARESFSFSDKIPDFLKIEGLCLDSCIGFSII